ncbi:MAG TPA: lytic transglycosylase domain-containing protein [Thermoanaerobaculales bacterium]|nr:lytic transglycosylase domain-containing protein [Thermoanaerobaculales bacterium]HQL28677.1 lytic transglycosylase domain-containing protein [Thermoanaerobaculales bacterium]
MRTTRLCWLVAAAVSVTTCLHASLVELAESGQWERLLLVANRRAEQLPLPPEEALVAAAAARALGDRPAELRHLRRAAEGGPLADVARVELAEALVDGDPAQALDLAVPYVLRAATRPLRDAAVAVAAEALGRSGDADARTAVERSLRGLPAEQRRRLELGLARGEAAAGRARLVRLLASSAADLTALDAARALQALGGLTAEERWLVARSLFQHALYREAEPILEGLDGVASRAIPSWEVAFLTGRCAFREGRFDEAAARYRVAAGRAPGVERRAEIELHLARAHELAGRLDQAVEAAVRAVATRPDDDRRLYLARVRLRLDQPERAAAGIQQLRGRSARARGELLLAAYDLRRERWEAARRRLEAIRRGPARGPAAVLAAGLAADAGDAAAAMRLLDEAAAELDPFWAERARAQMARLEGGVVGAWRERCARAAATADPASRRRALARWAALEIDGEALARLRQEIGAAAGLLEEGAAPSFPEGLAGRLWRGGLRRTAVRWDPAGFPMRSAAEALWSAQQLHAFGAPDRGLRAADAAWRIAGSDLPARAYPERLQRAMNPLPFPEQTWRSAVESAVPWTLVSGVAREESRWDAAAISGVGARGLMQLMPGTAAEVAARRGLPPPALESLFDPELSLELGAHELGRLYGAFAGQPAPVAAAYNAGEAQARLWLAECGTPCPSERYVVSISFGVTSRYARDVLAAAAAYADLYGPTPLLAPQEAGAPGPPAAPPGLTSGGTGSPRAARPPRRATARSRR